jgi:hypothetical protein
MVNFDQIQKLIGKPVKKPTESGVEVMFDSLDDRIRHDVALEKSSTERIVEGLVIAVLSVVLFGGLYYAVRLLQ